MDVTKPCEFKWFGAMDVSKQYEFVGFGAMDVTKPNEFVRFGVPVRPKIDPRQPVPLLRTIQSDRASVAIVSASIFASPASLFFCTRPLATIGDRCPIGLC
jgi:hypothetical protein